MNPFLDPAHLRALLGVGLYLAAAAASGAATATKFSSRDMQGARIWLLIMLVLLGMAAWRWVDGDEGLRDFLGDWARRDGVYDNRRQVQGPLLLVMIVGIGAAAWLSRDQLAALGRGVARTDLRAACVTMFFVFYAIVRAISFHPVDALIYSSVGPLNINRIIDPAMAFAVLVLAVVAIFRKSPPRHRPGRSRH